MMLRMFITFFLLVHLPGLSISFQENLLDRSKDKILGAGSFGTVYLSSYYIPGRLLAPRLLVTKEIVYKIAERLASTKAQEDRLGAIKNILERISPDICLNHELFGSSLITNILGVFVSRKTGKVTYAMEPMVGGNLEQYLDYAEKNPSKFNLSWFKRSLARIALAIDYLHKKGWVWRDGSNKNVFIDFDTGLSKVSDFDLSQRISDLRNNNKAEDDWNDFGRRILREANSSLQENPLISEADKNLLKEAQALLSGPDFDTPGKITTLEGFKTIPLFKDIDWPSIENERVVMSFIPKDNPDYLTMIYGKESPDALNELLKPQQLLKAQNLTEFILSSSFINPINSMLPSNINPLDSAESYCNVFYPRR